jgi:hypothetical protein
MTQSNTNERFYIKVFEFVRNGKISHNGDNKTNICRNDDVIGDGFQRLISEDWRNLELLGHERSTGILM